MSSKGSQTGGEWKRLIAIFMLVVAGCDDFTLTPAEIEIRGRILNGDGEPFNAPVTVYVVNVLTAGNVQTETGRDGRFTLVAPHDTRGPIRVMVGGEYATHVRTLPQRVSARYSTDVPVPRLANQKGVDVGTWLVETYPQRVARLTRDFGPLCDAAAARERVGIPPAAVPLALIWTERIDATGWNSMEALSSFPPNVAAVCVRPSFSGGGYYRSGDASAGQAASTIQWKVVAIRSDGSTAETTFDEKPPAETLVIGGMAITGQEQKLRTRLNGWIVALEAGH